MFKVREVFEINKSEAKDLYEKLKYEYISHERFENVHIMMRRLKIWLDNRELH